MTTTTKEERKKWRKEVSAARKKFAQRMLDSPFYTSGCITSSCDQQLRLLDDADKCAELEIKLGMDEQTERTKDRLNEVIDLLIEHAKKIAYLDKDPFKSTINKICELNDHITSITNTVIKYDEITEQFTKSKKKPNKNK